MQLKKHLISALLLAALTIATWVFADATCPRCADVSQSPMVDNGFGILFYYTYDPPKHICAQPNDSRWECLTESGYTATTEETYWCTIPGEYPVYVSGPESKTYNPCWNDDTECGANG